MKFRNIICLFVAFLALSSCQKPFEKRWDLEVDSTSYRLGYNAGEFPLYVYCSSSWSAEFDAEVDWIRFEDGSDSGSGNGIIRLSYRHNEDKERSVNIVISSGSFEKTVNITQSYDSVIFDIK